MLRGSPVLFCLLLSAQLVFGQWDDSDRLPATFHSGRRDALRDLMPANSVAVFFSNPVRNRSNDVDYQFSQAPNLYYLSGHLEPNAVLVVFKDTVQVRGEWCREVLFVEERNPREELWTGERLGSERAKSRLALEQALPASEWLQLNLDWRKFTTVFAEYPDAPNGTNRDKADLRDLTEFLSETLRTQRVEVNPQGIPVMLARLREIKTPEEMVLMQKAVDITVAGFQDLMSSLKAGMHEYEAQALVEYHARKEGAEYMGYPSICGSGQNAAVLHYTFNRKKLKDGELFLVDIGGEYHGYTADITRTMPVSGSFSTEQKAIYDLVWSAQQAGIQQCRVGRDFRAAHKAAFEVISKGLQELGIIKSAGDADRYFMHGTSHYLGLDVHDAGTYQALRSGTVMTVEPGIYIPPGSPCESRWWNCSVRIEDDVLVTDSDPDVMSKALISKSEEIEAWMKSKASSGQGIAR
ncbi:MAG: aminopeptidase P family protein [Sphingobacteriales bacterium]|nr:aminopeptidase P family protein [Sphingobacteriales bacterium]